RPATVIRLQRMGVSAYWRWKSRSLGCRPQIGKEVRDLIRRMSLENPLWGCRFRKLDTSVSMVQSAQDRKRDDIPAPFDRARVGCVLCQRNMHSRRIVIGSVFRKNSSKVLCVDDDQMIRALAADRPDQALHISVLPGRAK